MMIKKQIRLYFLQLWNVSGYTRERHFNLPASGRTLQLWTWQENQYISLNEIKLNNLAWNSLRPNTGACWGFTFPPHVLRLFLHVSMCYFPPMALLSKLTPPPPTPVARATCAPAPLLSELQLFPAPFCPTCGWQTQSVDSRTAALPNTNFLGFSTPPALNFTLAPTVRRCFLPLSPTHPRPKMGAHCESPVWKRRLRAARCSTRSRWGLLSVWLYPPPDSLPDRFLSFRSPSLAHAIQWSVPLSPSFVSMEHRSRLATGPEVRPCFRSSTSLTAHCCMNHLLEKASPLFTITWTGDFFSFFST